MGQFEILQWLVTRRECGDASYRSYIRIYDEMRSEGSQQNYVNMWRSINRLHSSGLIEASIEGGILQRKVLFRARVISSVHTSDMKRVHNTYREVDEKSLADPEESAKAKAGGAAQRKRPEVGLRAARERRILW